MNLSIRKSKISKLSSVSITGSKSESNRLLLLQALFPQLCIYNLSNSDDSQLMQKALESHSEVIDIHHAGTAMRFLTAYFATRAGREITLTGSKRMQERPIKLLVDALNELGADISYSKNDGYPPLIIKGKKLEKSSVNIQANISSQYISALLLVGACMEQGLTIHLEGTLTSRPYLEMTLSLINKIGIETSFIENTIKIIPIPSNIKKQTIAVESDWSSASYFYSIVALSDVGTEIQLSTYKKDSLQGDSVLAEIYKDFGVETTYEKNHIIIKKASKPMVSVINRDLSEAPDIAQTIAVTCLGLEIPCNLTGLHTLKIKETDRLVALQNEFSKLGTQIKISDKELSVSEIGSLNTNISIDTYQDHRMAMAFAPLALKTGLTIKEAEVVSKSYPEFWNDLESIGFQLSK
jgi:3-phosphoshikimate 1-carboxyvinyltransferase